MVLLAVWFAAAGELLPSPRLVFGVLLREAASGELWFHLGATLARVCASFVIAMFVGAAIGFVMGRSPAADQWMDAWLVFFLNLPALVVIVLSYLWVGLVEAAAVAAVAINKIPNVAVTVREGARALNPQYFAVAEVFGFGFRKRWLDVILPQMLPYLAASARSGVALIWKIVLVVELLGRSNGVGFQIHLYFQLFDVAAILAYAVAFIIVMQAVEWLLLQPAERRANKWRQR